MRNLSVAFSELFQSTPFFYKERNSNLELYRIIVMLFIVAHHYVVNSGLILVMEENPLCVRSVFFYLFGMWGKTGINCFVLITGYFMCMSKICSRKFLKLLLEVEFYKVGIYVIFLLSGYEAFSVSGCIKSIIPMLNITDGFVSCFLVFYLCIPFLNILIHNMSKRGHLLLVALSLFIYTGHGILPQTHVTMNYVSWFCVLYFIASYVRFYGFPIMGRQFSYKQWGGVTIVAIFLSMASVIFMLYLSKWPYWFVSDSHHLMAVVAAVSSFMFFKDMPIGYSRLINKFGASTFGVLLIHANSDAMRRWLWRDTLDNVGHYTDGLFWLRPLVAVLLIFAICAVIDMLRIRFVERPFFEKVKFDNVNCAKKKYE